MANILLLDDNEIACRAMRGILTRGGHRCAIASDGETAWKLMRELVKIDLLLIEIKLKGENGLRFVERLRADPMLKGIPIVIYTVVNNHEVVKKALSFRIQNYLIKPYRDEAVYAEVAKASANSWRNLLFEEEKSFCAQMGFSPKELHAMRESLREEIKANTDFLIDCGETANGKAALEKLKTLIEQAEASGAWGVVELLTELQSKTDEGVWMVLQQARESLHFAAQLLFCHLNLVHVPDGFYSDEERKEKEEAKLRTYWLDTDIDRHGPLVNPSDVQRQLDELTAWPVVDTVSAAFVMNAGGRAPSLDQLMDFVSRDPWLTAQVLVAANKIERDDLVAIEDPNIAISLLGDLKLNELAKAMPIVEERAFYFPPITWAHFWMFQIGVARVARFSCQYLEFGDLLPNAYTAGLLHDLGKMLLAKFYPYGFQASIAYAKQRSVPLGEAEKKYIGWSSRELADHFGRKHGLPRLFSNVIQNVDTPHQTEEDADMTALIALSRHLCLKNHVGYSGNGLKDATLPLAETPAWEVLQRRVFPSFNLKLFEAKAHTYCEELKQELTGAVR